MPNVDGMYAAARNNFSIGMPNAQTHRSNFLSNDTAVLQQRLKEL